MASGTTYQALKRLAFLPTRDSLDNGSTIGGQEYDDVYFIGGTIENIAIDGVTSFIKSREVTTSGTINQLTTDTAIIVENNASQATTVNLLPSAQKGLAIYVKDGLGNAGTHNITIVPNGIETIDGQVSLVFVYNYQSALLVPISAGWSILA